MKDAGLLWIGPRSPRAAERRALEAFGFVVRVVQPFPEALLLMESRRPELIVLSTDLADGGLAARLREIEAAASRAWIAVAVPRRHEIHEALSAGAHEAFCADVGPDDFLARVMTWARLIGRLRAQTAMLRALARRVYDVQEDLTAVRLERDRLRAMIELDDVTGLSSAPSFVMHLRFVLECAGRYGGVVSLALLDVDGISPPARARAQELLRKIGLVVRESIRGADRAGRLSQGEFGVIMPATDSGPAAQVAERLRARICALAPEGAAFASNIGLATISSPRNAAFAADDLLSRASTALVANQHGGPQESSH